MRKLTAFLLLTVVLSACSDKIDDQVMVSTNLPMNGQQEIPAKQVSGNGTIDAYYNRSLHTLYYTVKWNSLTGNPVAGFGLYGSAGRGYRGTALLQAFSNFALAPAGAYSGSVFIDGVTLKEEDLLTGEYYINIPTAANPVSPTDPSKSGEIRGQIENFQ